MEFIDLSLVLAAFSAVAAGIVYGFAGFGAAYVLIPLLSLIYDAREAVAMVMMMVTLGSVGLAFRTARYAAWRQIGPMSVLAMATIPIGSMILLTVDPELMRRAIGAVILFFAAAMLFGVAYRGRRNLFTAAVAGIVGGVAHGAVGLGGLAVSLYVMSSQDPAAVQRAGVVVFSALVAAASTIVLTISGVVNSTSIARSLLLMIPFGITLWCGARVFRSTPVPIFRRIVLVLVLALGITTLVA
ncbi:MAG: hypothetical protein CL569_17025 [Alphaproteobacteria bacterium]|nr:hypothetical protein [Alphaproteobacteria bacterium]